MPSTPALDSNVPSRRLLSLKTRLAVILAAALIGYPLSIGPAIALMYGTGLATSPPAIWAFSTFIGLYTPWSR